MTNLSYNVIVGLYASSQKGGKPIASYQPYLTTSSRNFRSSSTTEYPQGARAMGKKATLTVGPDTKVVVKYCAGTCEPKLCVEEICCKPAEAAAGGECTEKKEGACAEKK